MKSGSRQSSFLLPTEDFLVSLNSCLQKYENFIFISASFMTFQKVVGVHLTFFFTVIFYIIVHQSTYFWEK